MTDERFRSLALALPESTEGAHHGHPDFRVRGRIFASLGPDGDWAMVKLTPHDQATLVDEQPTVFEACVGAWGRGGATRIRLAAARRTSAVRGALIAAWRHTAPERLVQAFDEGRL